MAAAIFLWGEDIVADYFYFALKLAPVDGFPVRKGYGAEPGHPASPVGPPIKQYVSDPGQGATPPVGTPAPSPEVLTDEEISGLMMVMANLDPTRIHAASRLFAKSMGAGAIPVEFDGWVDVEAVLRTQVGCTIPAGPPNRVLATLVGTDARSARVWMGHHWTGWCSHGTDHLVVMYAFQ